MSEDEREVAWAAGIFEGEGCIYLAENGVRLMVRMTDEDVLLRFCAIIGAGNMTGPYTPKTNKKPLYSWAINNHYVSLEVLKRLEPWLGERRRSKYLACVEETAAWPVGFTRRA